jgi:kynureninase
MMPKGFVPMLGADGWQLSNVNVLSSAAILASMEVFHKVDPKKLRRKSIALTGYAEYLINLIIEKTGIDARIITPKDPEARGCQLSLALSSLGREVFDYLSKNGVMVDWREPNLSGDQPAIIRLAPVPMYNTFQDVYQFAVKFEEAVNKYHG